jgi:perosamine synthetase
MVSILARSAKQCDALRRHLAQSGIETRPVFSPVHTMPMYAVPGERHPVAEDLAQRGMNLPSWPDLERAAVTEICECIAGYFRNA